MVAVGSDPGQPPTARLVDIATNATLLSVNPFEPAFTGGVRAFALDLTADGTPDLIAVAGPGGGPRLRAFDGSTGAELLDLFAYDPAFAGGVTVFGGPDTTGRPVLAVGAGPGGGPHVRVLTADGHPSAEFFAADPLARTGVADGTLPGLWETGGLFAPRSLVSAAGITAARPEGAADAYAVVHDRTLTADSLLTNDPDGCGCAGAGRTAVLEPDTGPSHGTFVDEFGEPTDGPNPDGTFRYRPDPGYVGEDAFEYRVVGGGHASDPIPVVISVTNSNPAVYGG